MATTKVSLSLNRNRPSDTRGFATLKRRRETFNEDDESDINSFGGEAETVSHFDKTAGGAIDESRPRIQAAPLIIPTQANRDWKAAANKRRRQTDRAAAQEHVPTNDSEAGAQIQILPSYGLSGAKTEPGPSVDSTPYNDSSELPTPSRDVPLTDDQRALDALLGRNEDRSNVIIPTQNSVRENMSESDAFRSDYVEAPAMASLEAYASMPVEEFGAAMLRGMGWKDGEGIGSQKGVRLTKTTKPQKAPERRSALLGIGAKEDKLLSQELGAWGRAAKGSKGEIKVYNPVLLRDMRTGEMLTEEELKEKQRLAEREQYKLEFEQKERSRKERRDREERQNHDRRSGRENHDDRYRYDWRGEHSTSEKRRYGDRDDHDRRRQAYHDRNEPDRKRRERYDDRHAPDDKILSRDKRPRDDSRRRDGTRDDRRSRYN